MGQDDQNRERDSQGKGEGYQEPNEPQTRESRSDAAGSAPN